MAIEIHRGPNFTEHRKARRAPLNLPSTLRERSRSAVPGEVQDLSSNGCRIESSAAPLPGNTIFVRLPGLESLSGRIAWTNGSTAGVRFDQPLHPAVAARYLPRAANDPLPEHTAAEAPTDNVVKLEPLLSRREQIVSGIAAADRSPLSRTKRPTGTGILDTIIRQVPRVADHRREERFADPVTVGAMTLQIGGHAAQIGDVSASGLGIRSALHAEIGSKVALEFSGFEPIEARVVWLRGGAAGLSLPDGAIELQGAAAG